jgi:hypothetical protein
MNNTIGTDLFVVIGGGAAVGLLAWMLVDGLRTGKLPLKYGGVARRDTQPVGFWLVMAVGAVLACLCGYGVLAAFFDLIYR